MIDRDSDVIIPDSEYRALELRDLPEEIERQSAKFNRDTLAGQMLDAVPDPYMAVNRRLQVLFANEALATIADRDRSSLYGERFGDLLNCVNADTEQGGCGTSEACRTCGFTGSILEAFSGKDAVREARLTLKDGRSVDMGVHAKLMDGAPEATVLVSIVDIEHEQRRRVLERTFFHDILNTAGGVQGLVGILPFADADESPELIELLDRSATQLVDEIQSQRLLIDAEAGELAVECVTIDAVDLVTEVTGFYRNHDVGIEKHLVVELPDEGSQIEFASDPTLVRRILGNLVKNALEASELGMTVTVGGSEHSEAGGFWVHNDGVIPRRDQFQIFQRSFSTKGKGRGIGTYSVRMFTETYLGGEVTFFRPSTTAQPSLSGSPASHAADRRRTRLDPDIGADGLGACPHMVRARPSFGRGARSHCLAGADPLRLSGRGDGRAPPVPQECAHFLDE